MKIRDCIKGKRILITGGTGTIGKEVLRRILPLSPKVVRIFSRDENKHFHLQAQLREHKNVRFLIGDVRDKERLHMALEDVDFVIHLAAMKHVEGSEYNPFEAIKTNIVGTQNLVETALDRNVNNMVFSSSDKAVNPSNAMGASKLMAEKVMVAANFYKGEHPTIFSSIRFGNVLGSSGSVLPTFISRIRNGEPIELTSPEMTRFVTTFSDSVELLLTSYMMATGGEIFVRKMPVIRIVDLAEVLCEEFAGLYGQRKTEIRITGVRPGEKMAEELFTLEESTRTLEFGNYYIIRPQIGQSEIPYGDARPIKVRTYSSADQKPLDKKELRDLLYRDETFSKYMNAGGGRPSGFQTDDQFTMQMDPPLGGVSQ